jgi:mono/diheme cytochrome c family protein
MKLRPALLLMSVTALAACRHENMYTQPKQVTWGTSAFFSRGMTMRHSPSGTVARNPPNQPAPQPKRITAAMLARGRQQFNIDCAPCHAFSGNGEGMIVSRGFPKPPALYSRKVRSLSARQIFGVITHGKGAMYPYGPLIEPKIRWDIVAYIRALQLSQHATVARLPAQDQKQLAALRGRP